MSNNYFPSEPRQSHRDSLETSSGDQQRRRRGLQLLLRCCSKDVYIVRCRADVNMSADPEPARYTPVVVTGRVADTASSLLSADPALLSHTLGNLNKDEELRAEVLDKLCETFSAGAAAGHFAGRRAQMAIMVRAYVASKALPTELAAWCVCVLMSDRRSHALWGRACALLPAFEALLSNFVRAKPAPYPLNLQTSGYVVHALATAAMEDPDVARAIVKGALAPAGVLAETVGARSSCVCWRWRCRWCLVVVAAACVAAFAICTQWSQWAVCRRIVGA